MNVLNNKKLIRERIEQGTRKSGNCHIWQLHETAQGFGYMGISGCIFAVRRVAWWLKHGYMPSGKCLRDTCGNKLCHNPDHLVDSTPECDRRPGLLRPGSKKSEPAFTEDEEDRIWELSEIEGKTLYRIAKDLGATWKSVKKALARAKIRLS